MCLATGFGFNAGNCEGAEYYQNKIDGLYHDVFGFIGWSFLPAFIAYGVQQKTELERLEILNDYQKHLIKHTLEANAPNDSALNGYV